MTHLIIVTDPCGLILEANPAACRALGYSLAELRLMTPEAFHDRDEVSTAAATLSVELGEPIVPGFAVFVEKARRGRPTQREWTYIRRDGSRFPVLLSVTSLRDEGRIIGFVGISIDLSEHRDAARAKLEAETARLLASREAEAREAAERANRAKSRFLAAASHDLRQPMQALRLYFDVLRTQLEEPRALQLADRMAEAMGAGEALLNTILDLSYLDSGMTRVQLAELDPVPLVEACCDRFQARVAQHGLQLRRRLAKVAPVCTDATLLDRVLSNLIDNAVKYTREGAVLVALRPRGDHVLLQVADTGIGIEPGHQDAIFDEFYQVGNEERAAANGLGVGLSVVKKTATLLGIPLTLRSRPGHGTCFTLEIPLAGCPLGLDAGI